MKNYKNDYFFTDYLRNRETPPKSSWNQYIDTLIRISSQDEWRESLKSRPELSRFAEVHTYIEPHPLWSLSLQHPEYTFIDLIISKRRCRTATDEFIFATVVVQVPRTLQSYTVTFFVERFFSVRAEFY